MIKDMQRTAALKDQSMAAATLVAAQAEAMKEAAKNPNGAMAGFMGFGMAQNAGASTGMNVGQMYQAGQAQSAARLVKFCPECGYKIPDPENPPKFCPNCGKPVL